MIMIIRIIIRALVFMLEMMNYDDILILIFFMIIRI